MDANALPPIDQTAARLRDLERRVARLERSAHVMTEADPRATRASLEAALASLGAAVRQAHHPAT